MAYFGKDIQNVSASSTIRIVSAVSIETYTVYVIEVTLGTYTWTVRHRYSDFHDLHEKLVAGYKLDKSLLPPKKLFGNQNEAFIKKRQNELEIYLQTVLYLLAPKIPTVLAFFLDFNKYEIHGITQALAEELYNRGESILQTVEMFEMTPLQLYALTERLKLPEPTCDSGDVKKDIGHILDFITRVKALKIAGSPEHFESSNIDMNQLNFDLTLFKSLQKVEIVNCSPKAIGGLETIKQTLQTLVISRTLSSIREFLLQDIPYWRADDGTLLVEYWSGIASVDLRGNYITQIDDSVQLMPKVESLDLSNNKVETVEHLQWLSQLTSLDLSSNLLRNLDSLHTKLGNLTTLKLANNLIESLHGFSKLFSLISLDISNNEVAKICEVKHLSGLPCLEILFLVGNPVTITLDYRTKVLELFGDRVREIILDNEHPSQKELDTVAVLQALQKSKDNKEKVKKLTPKKVPSSASLAESPYSYSDTPPDFTGETTYGINPSPVVGQDILQSQSPVLQTHVEALRRKAGSNWLEELNKEVDVYNTKKASPVSSVEKCSSAFTPCTQDTPVTSSVLVDSSIVGSSVVQDKHYGGTQQRRIMFLNPADLPTKSNHDFLQWVQREFIGAGNMKNESPVTCSVPGEPVIDVLWCTAVQYSNVDAAFPCCAVLTKNNLFLQRMTNLESDFPGVPDFEPFYILPLKNIQQVIIGCCFSYIRFEESFVFQTGTFNLIGLDPNNVKNFVECFKEVSEMSVPDIIDMTCHSDFVNQIFVYEERFGIASDRIVFSAVVTVTSTGDMSLLLLSETRLYLIHKLFIHWPLPTYESPRDELLESNILQSYPVILKISDIKMSQTEQSKDSCNNSEMTKHYKFNFIEYGLSMIVHESSGPQTFDIWFLSTSSRDLFLDRLTNLRAEHANRMSPTYRQEPEGGNESVGETDQTKPSPFVAACSLPSSFDMSKFYVSQVHRGTDVLRQPSKTTSKDLKIEVPSNDLIYKVRGELKAEDATLLAGVGIKTDVCESKVCPSYLNSQLECHLKNGVRTKPQFQPLPTKLKPFALMDGYDLVSFFHNNISVKGKLEVSEGLIEELRHVVWTSVLPYNNHNEEIITLVMLSTLAIYLVSSSSVHCRVSDRPSWMTHSRHQSDSAVGWKSKECDQHECGKHQSKKKGLIKPYCILKYTDLQQVNVGLFDQCVRLTGLDAASVFTLVFRDSCVTGEFLEQLTNMLSLIASSPMVDRDKRDLETDFYRAFTKRTKSTVEGLEYTHPSQVRFCYPGEDAVEDILYLVRNQTNIHTGVKQTLWMFILCHRVPLDFMELSSENIKPRSLILTNTHLCLAEEDVVTYPLPDFVRGLPENPRHQIVDTRKIENLKRLVLPFYNDHLLCLVFSDEQEEIVVDTSLEHFSGRPEVKGRQPRPEYKAMLYIHSLAEKQKLVHLLGKHWKELNPEVGRILDVVSELC